MLIFCNEIENNPQRKLLYHKKVEQLAKWYTTSVSNYSTLLKTEVGMSQMSELLEQATEARDILADMSEDLALGFSAKLSYFCISDALVKLILSKYSYGPTKSFLIEHEISAPDWLSNNTDSWIACSCNEPVMTELLAKVLYDENTTFQIDLTALSIDRKARNKLAHSSNSSPCLSAMRCYNVIRSMLVFLDSDYESTLPAFEFEDMFNYDNFLMEPCSLNFNDCTTILIADSVHDVRLDYRRAVANLPWDIVIDLDGYSEAGGLLSAVNHNRIQKEVLYKVTASKRNSLPNEKTLWLKCGDYQSYNYFPTEKDVSIIPHIAFHFDPTFAGHKIPRNFFKNNLISILKKVMLLAKTQERLINIVAVTNDSNFIKRLLDVLSSDINIDDYFLSWVGLLNNDALISDWFDDESVIEEQFRYHRCPISQFYQAFSEHSSSWTPRDSIHSNFTLPGSDGCPIPIREVERNNLADNFDVLYDHCEDASPEESQKLEDAFFRGNTISWNTLSNQQAISLRKPKDFERMKQSIRTLLGRTQESPQKRLFFISHAPGIGGTTLARQLVWALHRDYAVLEVRNYSSITIKARIEHLYDVVLDKAPIIILADDTLPSLKALCDDILHLNRRCILVVACRQSNPIPKIYPHATHEAFLSLNNDSINLLKDRYRKASPLDSVSLASKDRAFYSVLSGSMLTPFIIGLYYIEKDFNIDIYVKKALSLCPERRYADLLAQIAICDRYNCKNIPVALVKKILCLPVREDFLRVFPEASSLIASERSRSGTDCYHFKHPLLGSRYFDFYCQEYYGSTSNQQNALYEQVSMLIHQIAVSDSSLEDNYINILITLLIQNKGLYSENTFLSALMLDIGMPESQLQLMHLLAEQFRPFADDILQNPTCEDEYNYLRQHRSLLRLVSHAYAHLGRMYSKIAGNYDKAYEFCSLAIEYMPDRDPDVYHMAGTALLDKLKKFWTDYAKTQLSAEQVEAMRNDVDEASRFYDLASDYGSPNYGLPSKLELLYNYLQFYYTNSGIHSNDDLNKLGDSIRELQAEFINVSEEAQSYNDLPDTAISKIEEYEDKFKSQIMFGNFSKAIEYYQNQLDKYRGTSNIAKTSHALRSLVFTRINAAKYSASNSPFYRTISHPDQMILDIETLLNQPYDNTAYGDYTKRTQLFHYWMQLAKFLSRSIEDGLIMARRWMDMELRNKTNINPEPYYYIKILLFLSVKEGSSLAVQELREITEKISYLDTETKFDRRRGHLDRIRDIFVIGRNMGQLFDVTSCHSEEDMILDIASNHVTPIIAEGLFNEAIYETSAVLQLSTPINVRGENVRMDISKSSQSAFTTEQLGHRLEFLLGFSVEHPYALSRSAMDKDANEHLEFQKLCNELRKNCPVQDVTAKPNTPINSSIPTHNSDRSSVISVPDITNFKKPDATFFASDFSATSLPPYGYLRGYVNKKHAIVPIDQDLSKYGDDIERNGGMPQVLKLLVRKHGVPCTVKSQSLENGEVRYTVSIFECNPSLSTLLNTSSAISSDNTSEIPPKQSYTTINVKAGTIVDVHFLKTAKKLATGMFDYNNTQYVISVKITHKKDVERIQDAIKKNNLLRVRITCQSKDGTFSGQLV